MNFFWTSHCGRTNMPAVKSHRLCRRAFMNPNLSSFFADVRTRSAWQTQIAAARHIPGLLPTLMQQRQTLFPRFAAAYRQLRALPQRMRRRLQRRYRHSLAGVALLMTLGVSAVLAYTITVDGTTCTLINAITTANSDTDTGGCVQTPAATAGADTVVLQPSSAHTLTATNNNTYGANGLPVVISEMTIEGNTSTITRDSGAENFRILAVSGTGKLTLKATTISGGVTSGSGGGIFNRNGLVTLIDSTVSGNSADNEGGGIYNLAASAGAN